MIRPRTIMVVRAGRVLYVVRRYPVLSQTFVTNEVRVLTELGWDVQVVTVSAGGTLATDVSADFELASVRTDPWTVGRAFMRLGLHPARAKHVAEAWMQIGSEIPGSFPANLFRVLALAQTVRRHSPDVIHAHFGWEGAALAWLLAVLLDKPWGVTLHANDMFGEPVNLDEKIRAANLVVTVCDYNVRWLREHLAVERPIEKVVCGVEVPPKTNRERPSVDVLAVGRLVEKKGFDVLIQALSRLQEDGEQLRCAIVGDGPEDGRLRELVRAVGAESVEFLGPQRHEDVLTLLLESRLVVVPSRVARNGDVDSMPLVAKEAMARGIPVVATNVGGIAEMVDAQVGALVPPDDATALAMAIREVLSDDEAYTRRSALARERVLSRFTLAKEVSKMSGLLRRTAGLE